MNGDAHKFYLFYSIFFITPTRNMSNKLFYFFHANIQSTHLIQNNTINIRRLLSSVKHNILKNNKTKCKGGQTVDLDPIDFHYVDENS